MQKVIRIMAIIAAALAGLTLLLLLVTFPFQRTIGRLYSTSPAIYSALPQFPILPFFIYFLRAICIGLLIICCGNRKGGIWLELVLIGFLAILIPGINRISAPVFTVIISRFGGSMQLAANSIVSNITSFCSIPAAAGQTLAYITCGMSIAFKAMNKRTLW